MTRRLRTSVVATAACLALGPPSAQAAPPERVENTVLDPAETVEDEFLTEACGVPVTSSARGHVRLTLLFDRSGEISRVVAHPSSTNTLTSPYGTLTTSDRGMDRTTFNADGTVTVFGTGVHPEVAGGAHAIGLEVLTLDGGTGELLDAEYHGRFDVVEPEIVPHICDRLGPARGGIPAVPRLDRHVLRRRPLRVR
ncbi:hypothetical protein JD79_03442 [Geodermatophilus normandii]|uniref:Uncharacterized protein n=1 Tax=Geodermatophilus normandii TaxID=1137989 RepID=A0A317QMT0_9ACTN|nr:hypothetical protein [Geodermatophilus normandii]PWW24263.1 hypothetical protein JD79_03442 [Geodermatophilus normandii]